MTFHALDRRHIAVLAASCLAIVAFLVLAIAPRHGIAGRVITVTIGNWGEEQDRPGDRGSGGGV